MKGNPRVWGWVLLGLGGLCLLQTLGVQVVGWVWGLIFAAGGAVFLGAYGRDPTRWWALLPGSTLLGLGALILLQPILGDHLGGAVFLASIGLGFLAVYAVRREFWWAILPTGTLLTLAVEAGLGEQGEAGGFLFFLGLALTFVAVYMVGHRWAIFPSGALLVLALFTFEGLRGALAYVFPLALIAGGAYRLLRGEKEVRKT